MDKKHEFVGYEYKGITVSKKFENTWKDAYSSLGWRVVDRQATNIKPLWAPIRVMISPLAILPGDFFKNMVTDHESKDKVDLKFKRNREIRDKKQLNSIESNLEKTLRNMEKLEYSKIRQASYCSYIIGLLGTIFMGLSTFSYLDGNLKYCIIFAIPGFCSWIGSYIAYHILETKKENEIKPMIEEGYQKINDLSSKAYQVVVEI